MNIKQALDIFINEIVLYHTPGLAEKTKPDYARLANEIVNYNADDDISLVIKSIIITNIKGKPASFQMQGESEIFSLPQLVRHHCPMSYLLARVSADVLEPHLKALYACLEAQTPPAGKKLVEGTYRSVWYKVEEDQTPKENELTLNEQYSSYNMSGFFDIIDKRHRTHPAIISLKNWLDTLGTLPPAQPFYSVNATLTLSAEGATRNMRVVSDISTRHVGPPLTDTFARNHNRILCMPRRLVFNDVVKVRALVVDDNMYLKYDDTGILPLKDKKRKLKDGQRGTYYLGEQAAGITPRTNKDKKPEKSALKKKPSAERLLCNIAEKYKAAKFNADIAKSGAVMQGNYEFVAGLKMQVYQVFINEKLAKGSESVKPLAEWIISGNENYSRFSKNWKSTDPRVVLISLLSHHTDSMSFYFKNTDAYKIIRDIAQTGDLTALEADIKKKEGIIDKKGGPSRR